MAPTLEMLTEAGCCLVRPSGSLEVMKGSSAAPSRAEREQTEATLAPGECALFDWKVFGTRNRNEVSGTYF